jgi:O-antigen/teichoic acid export membrane protein
LSQVEQTSDFSNSAIHGTAWRYVAMFSGKFMVFVSTIVLARLLTKDDFGLVGYAVTVIAFLESLSDLGVTAAVIYHPDDQERVSTAFWINQISGAAFFLLTWISAPAIALYFQDERVVDVIRLLSLTFPLLALGYMQEAVLLKKLSFKLSFVPAFIKSMAKGVASIAFAFAGFGAWSLIWGQLVGTLVSSITYWIVTPWRPDFVFNFKMAFSLLKYGLTFIIGEMIALLLMYLDYFLIGRYLGSEKLGVYTLAFRMPDLIILEFARTLSNVLFPIYAQMREKTGTMARAFFLVTRYISLLTVPLGLGLVIVAEPFILTFFTEKWIEAVPVVRGIAIYATVLSVVHNTTSVYWAEGRPQTVTWIGIARLVLLFPGLLWAVIVMQSIAVVGWVHAGMAVLSALLNFYVASRLIGLSIKEIGRALSPALLSGLLMTLTTYPVMISIRTLFDPWLQLSLAVAVGGITYVVSLWFLQRDIVLSVGLRVRAALGRA